MKIRLPILIWVSLFVGPIEAEIKTIENGSVKNGLRIFITTVCIDGYKFVVADGTTQFFEIKEKKIVPAKCDNR